ncbi:hypothetical protein HPB48_016014 [Haemaphysalis longicornis]|uniref:Protein masquerade clip-domain domain-containing protein n=1 Tax=Haemaphysalis longicornis TaxID=44386 RepID=A0A9J6G0M0_HAELO|nr:hypothetical protein HPB48_016014 [Haemaphysalis longicornis]
MARHQPAERLGASWLVAALFLLLLDTRAQAQDTSAILSGILGSLTSTTKARGCPGECVHAITALLCDHVVDEIQCGASYLRCCVPKDLSLGGTAVETSAPLAEEEALPAATTPATAPVEDANVTVATPTAETPRPPEPSALPSATSPRDVCPGVCVGKGLSQYCHRVLPAPSCGPDAVCCTSADGPPEAEPQQQQQQPVDGPPQQPARDQELPECPGSCVSPLLSILCDHVSTAHSCPTGGSCCISAAAATTTEPPAVACDGRCLPPFLSGVCQKPAQLVLRTTTCPSGSICCSPAPFFGGGGHPSQQRPFGAIIPRPYRPQDNAVIPVDQAMMDHQLALQESHRRPQHEQQLRPLRDQGSVHPVKQNGHDRPVPAAWTSKRAGSSLHAVWSATSPAGPCSIRKKGRPNRRLRTRRILTRRLRTRRLRTRRLRTRRLRIRRLRTRRLRTLRLRTRRLRYARATASRATCGSPASASTPSTRDCAARRKASCAARTWRKCRGWPRRRRPPPTSSRGPPRLRPYTLPPVPEQPDATPPEPPAPSESPPKQRRPKPPTRDALVSNDLPQETPASTEAAPASTTRAPSVAKGRRPARPSTCGIKGTSGPDRRHAARITGGKDSLPGEWCWQVSGCTPVRAEQEMRARVRARACAR